jgi:hypothetical protein
MKLDLSKLKRVNLVKNNFKTKSFVLDEVDEFEREDEQRQRALDDSGVVVEVDDLLINSNPADEPDELRAMLNMSVEPDYSDPKVADLVSKSVSEVLCPTESLWVARNFECLCGAIHR